MKKKLGKSVNSNNRRILRGADHSNFLVPIVSTSNKKVFNSRDSYEGKKLAFSPSRFRTIALDSKPDYSHHIKMSVGKMK